MNSRNEPKRSPDTCADDCQRPASERCLQYLLGELSALDSAAFEEELADSGELNDELLAQSELLLAIANAGAGVDASAGVEAGVAVDVDGQRASAAMLPGGRSQRRTLRWIVSLAACLAIAWLGARLATDPANEAQDEELQIARAWAAEQQLVSAVEEEPRLPEEPTLFELQGESSHRDAVVGWMLVAVAADDADSGTGRGGHGDG